MKPLRERHPFPPSRSVCGFIISTRQAVWGFYSNISPCSLLSANQSGGLVEGAWLIGTRVFSLVGCPSGLFLPRVWVNGMGLESPPFWAEGSALCVELRAVWDSVMRFIEKKKAFCCVFFWRSMQILKRLERLKWSWPVYTNSCTRLGEKKENKWNLKVWKHTVVHKMSVCVFFREKKYCYPIFCC